MIEKDKEPNPPVFKPAQSRLTVSTDLWNLMIDTIQFYADPKHYGVAVFQDGGAKARSTFIEIKKGR